VRTAPSGGETVLCSPAWFSRHWAPLKHTSPGAKPLKDFRNGFQTLLNFRNLIFFPDFCGSGGPSHMKGGACDLMHAISSTADGQQTLLILAVCAFWLWRYRPLNVATRNLARKSVQKKHKSKTCEQPCTLKSRIDSNKILVQ